MMLPAASLGLFLAACDGPVPGGGTISLADFSNQELAPRQRPSLPAADVVLVEAGLSPSPQPRIMPKSPTEFTAFFEVEGQPGRPVIVDSLIGQVNGQPIYADEVLAPLMDRLAAMYEELPDTVFRKQMYQLVGQELTGYVQNELIVAESRAELSPEAQTGLLAFMDELRDDAVRKRGGVVHEAERRLLEEEGKTIEEYVDAERQKVLIHELLREKITPKTLVSWRDIERAYRAGIREFQPSPTVTLGRIRLKTAGNEAHITLISEELAAGEPFDVVARQAGMADDGRWQTFELPASGLSDISLAPFYKPGLEEIRNGGTSKAFERGPWTMWISLLEVTRPPIRTLDDPDVQRKLQQQLVMARRQRAQGQYVYELLQRGIHDEIAVMVDRAFNIADSRFPPR
jgi:hypothetical protein